MLNAIQEKCLAAGVLYSMSTMAFAEKIKKPGFVDTYNSDSIEKAGKEINGWLLAFIAVVIVAMVVVAAYYFVRGRTEEGADTMKNVILGAVVATVGAGVVFGIIGAM